MRFIQRTAILIASGLAVPALGAIPAAASAAQGMPPPGGISRVAAAAGLAPVHITKLNLRSAFAKALGKAKHGRIEAKAAPYAPHRKRAVKLHQATAGPCAEPNCDMSYAGGPVQHAPRVYLLLWGPNWSSTGADTRYLSSFYSALGSSNDAWSRITSQYADSSGHPVFSGPVLQGVYQDVNTPVGSDNGAVSSTDLTAEADAFARSRGVSDLGNAQVVIASQSGTCFDDGWAGQPGSCANPGPGIKYCAWHASSGYGETFTNLPYSPNAGTLCGMNFVNPGSAGTYDGFSIVGGHEYAETITDPVPPTGWGDPSDQSGGEIGDKCAWGGASSNDPIGNVTIGTGSYAMQSLWSNAYKACVLAAGIPPYRAAVQGSNSSLHVFSSTGRSQADFQLPMKAGTSPAVATLANGSQEKAVQLSTGELVTAGPVPAFWDVTHTQQGMMAGTSPSIAASSDGGYEVAFQANTGHLFTYSSASGPSDLGYAMAPGTSPSITALTGGGYEIAFQASDGNLYTTGPVNPGDWYLGMKSGTSPSITARPGGGYDVAFQANTGNLWVVGNNGDPGDTGLGMAPGTSPAIITLDAGFNGYEVAFQANTGSLWVIGADDHGDLRLGMKSGTSPALSTVPGGGWEVAFQATTGYLWTTGYDILGNTGVTMAPGTSPAISSP